LNFDSSASDSSPKIFVLEFRQDDPSKNTAAKMRKFGLALPTRRQRISPYSIVLNPTASSTITKSDANSAHRNGLVVIDCSWNQSEQVFNLRFKGIQRKLPSLLAGNPTNYAKLGKLSSIEAVSAALYIMNFKSLAEKILSLYKWGPTFLSLNRESLEDYSKAESIEQIHELERLYFPHA
jgi:pre-rRNA-processing protein TSR3